MKNILVFPCGSEVALEIHSALKFSTHFKLVGASSVLDHGRYVFEDYIGDLPFHNQPDFLQRVKNIVIERDIAGIIPAMDSVLATLKKHEAFLGCRIISPPLAATKICLSKKKTYTELNELMPVPAWSDLIEPNAEYPLFVKPDIGYGSRNTFVARNRDMVDINLDGERGNFLFCEYLPGDEFTIDCFSNRHGALQFAGVRRRIRISNGISVNTQEDSTYQDVFHGYAKVIHKALNMRGAWFFQMKEDKHGKPKLLEVSARLAGSSSLFRSKGVNLPLLALFDAFDMDVNVEENNYEPVLDRALASRYILPVKYSTIYIDYDDCILLGDVLNHEAISFLFHAIDKGKKIVLISRHVGDLFESLRNKRILHLFDEIVHLTNEEIKSSRITDMDSIFIDDSFSERAEVKKALGIPTFSPDMIEALL